MPRTVISLDEVIRVTGSANPFRAMGSVTFRFRFADASSISALLSFVGGSIADRLKRSLSAAMPDIMQEADISVGAPSAWSNTAGLYEAKITVVMPVAAVARTLALVSADGLINIDRIYGDNQDYPVEVVGSVEGHRTAAYSLAGIPEGMRRAEAAHILPMLYGRPHTDLVVDHLSFRTARVRLGVGAAPLPPAMEYDVVGADRKGILKATLVKAAPVRPPVLPAPPRLGRSGLTAATPPPRPFPAAKAEAQRAKEAAAAASAARAAAVAAPVGPSRGLQRTMREFAPGAGPSGTAAGPSGTAAAAAATRRSGGTAAGGKSTPGRDRAKTAGTAAMPSGAAAMPSGAAATPSGAAAVLSGAAATRSGAAATPSGTAAMPSGAAATPSGAAATPSGAAAEPSGAATAPVGAAAMPSGAAAAPSGLAVARQPRRSRSRNRVAADTPQPRHSPAAVPPSEMATGPVGAAAAQSGAAATQRGTTATRAGMPTRRTITAAAAAEAAATEATAQRSGDTVGPSGATGPAMNPASPASFAAVVMGSLTRGLEVGSPEYQAAVDDLTRKMIASRTASAADKAEAARSAAQAAVARRATLAARWPSEAVGPPRPPGLRSSRSPQHSGETPDQQRRRVNMEGDWSAAPHTSDLDTSEWPQLQQQDPPVRPLSAIRMAPNPYGALEMDDPGDTSRMEVPADQ